MIEYRSVAEMKAEVRDNEGTLHGLVTPFNSWTTIGSGPVGPGRAFRERNAPGMFTKTLQERDAVLIDSHDTSKPMARTSIADPSQVGHLGLKENRQRGLEAFARPVQTSYAKDVMLLADAGVVRGMSYGFEVVKDEWTDDDGNPSDRHNGTHRTIREVRLMEVTTTAFPAYTDTELAVRAVGSARGTLKTPVQNARAAAAVHEDLYTCAECGATSQYGAFCTSCGEPMIPDDALKGYCASCGSAVGGNSPGVDDSGYSEYSKSHVCETRQPDEELLTVAAELLSFYNSQLQMERSLAAYDIRAGKPYGDVEYADPKNGKYPVNSKKRALAAWAYINVAKNAAEYPLNGVSLASVKAKIRAALKKFGIKASEEKGMALKAEKRDVVDGDGTPDSGWLAVGRILHAGGVPGLLGALGDGQLSDQVKHGIGLIIQNHEALTEHVGATDGHGAVSEPADGHSGEYDQGGDHADDDGLARDASLTAAIEKAIYRL